MSSQYSNSSQGILTEAGAGQLSNLVRHVDADFLAGLWARLDASGSVSSARLACRDMRDAVDGGVRAAQLALGPQSEAASLLLLGTPETSLTHRGRSYDGAIPLPLTQRLLSRLPRLECLAVGLSAHASPATTDSRRAPQGEQTPPSLLLQENPAGCGHPHGSRSCSSGSSRGSSRGNSGSACSCNFYSPTCTPTDARRQLPLPLALVLPPPPRPPVTPAPTPPLLPAC